MHNAHTCLYVDICDTPWCSAEQSKPIAHFPSIALNKSVWQLESQENVRIYSRTLEEKNNNNLQELCQFRFVKISRTKITLSDALASLCHSNSVSNVPCSVEGRVKNIFLHTSSLFFAIHFQLRYYHILGGQRGICHRGQRPNHRAHAASPLQPSPEKEILYMSKI